MGVLSEQAMTGHTSEHGPVNESSSRITRRKLLATTAAMGTASLVAGCTSSGSTSEGEPSTSESEDLTFTSGPSNSLAFGMGNAMSSVVQDNSDLTINLKSGTSGQSIASVVSGQTDLSFGTTLVGTRAMNGSGDFAEVESTQTLLQLPSFYFMRLGGYASVNSEIEYFSDLEGKSLGPGPAGASYWGVWDLALQKALNMDELETQNSGVNRLSDLLSSERVAAIGGPTLSNNVTPGFMQQALSQNNVRMLSYRDETLQALEEDPKTPLVDVEKERVSNIDEFTADGDTVPMVSANYTLWSSDAVSTEAIYTLFKTAWENREALGETHAAFNVWSTKEWYTKNMTPEVPVHPGAVQFLKEIDAWSDEFTKGST